MIAIIQCFTDKVWLRGEREIDGMCRLVCGEQADQAPKRARKTIELTIEFYNVIFPGGMVDFGDGKVIQTLTKLWKEFLRNKLVNPDLIFASRAEMGMYNLLHRIGARVDTSAILESVSKMTSPVTRAPDRK